jgi:hypothetical protein
VIMMEILNALIDGTSVFSLLVYCAVMILLLGGLAWANYLDDRSEVATLLSTPLRNIVFCDCPTHEPELSRRKRPRAVRRPVWGRRRRLLAVSQ